MINLSAKEIFQKYQGRASKAFGQNYIFSRALNSRIVDFAGGISGRNVLEIGPGPGGLTVEIIDRHPKSLTLVEIDHVWINAWSDMASQYDFINVIPNDALKLDFSLMNVDVIISNLPYNVSSPILFKILVNMQKYEKLILMFQKEVADRIMAKPNNKQYGRLSVMTQIKAYVSKKMDLSPNCFTPAPKVYSTVLSFEPRNDTIDVNFELVDRLVKAAFSNRRKYVIRSLSNAFPACDFVEVFQQLDIPANARAEQISPDQYIDITHCLHDLDCNS